MEVTKTALIWAFVCVVLAFITYYILTQRHPLAAIKGALKGAYWFLIGLCTWIVIPIPGPETLINIPIANHLQETHNWSFKKSFIVAYVIVWCCAATILALHWFFLRHYIKTI